MVEAAEICSLQQALVLDPATARAGSLVLGALQKNLQVVAPAFHCPVVIYGGGVFFVWTCSWIYVSGYVTVCCSGLPRLADVTVPKVPGGRGSSAVAISSRTWGLLALFGGCHGPTQQN